VLRTPEHWDRIVALAAEHHGQLPAAPDPVALNTFLAQCRQNQPAQFPDLSLAVIKLLGRGEYALEEPGATVAGHFGLAVTDYMHATAPNRRFPDVIAQRLIKSVLNAGPAPYTRSELEDLASHCTLQEDNAAKVERRVGKSAAALLLRSRTGQTFDAIVTGAADKGTWARTLVPPVEGRIVRGFEGLKVGQQVRVRLLSADVIRGFIDFACER
jgi:exoribonuclease R